MAAQHSVIRGGCIEYGFWLTFDDKGGVKLTRGMPQVGRWERAVAMTAKLPKSLFSTPQLRAEISIPDYPANEPITLNIEAAANAFKAAIGVDCDISITPLTLPQTEKEETDDVD
jgi:hypothetical protein